MYYLWMFDPETGDWVLWDESKDLLWARVFAREGLCVMGW